MILGPAPAKGEDVDLSWLQLASVENLVSDLLAQCGYERTKRYRLPSERFAIGLAHLFEKNSKLLTEIFVKMFGKSRT